jgi:hypothetical protein
MVVSMGVYPAKAANEGDMIFHAVITAILLKHHGLAPTLEL